MREIIQLVVSFTGSLGFAALFNIHGKKLWFAAVGGCLSWAVYLAVEFITPSPYVCGFWSTVAITLYAECMARIHKTPVTVFLVSATIPLIPGAALYRTMNWMLMKDWAKFQKDGIYTILFAVSMAAGMTLTTIAFRMAWRWMYRQRRNSPFTNHRKCVTIFPYGKLVEEESTCVHRTTGKSPENFLYKEFRD